jgi:hypothetical protein
MFELIGSVVEEANMDNGQAWIAAMYEELAGAGEALKSEYPSLLRPSGIHVSRCFGEHRGFWQELKRKYDPEAVFDLAVTRLKED